MVYPGAVHTRFEHSLGVYWLAGEAVQMLKKYQVIESYTYLAPILLIAVFLFFIFATDDCRVWS